jgi:hypothetical protein
MLAMVALAAPVAFVAAVDKRIAGTDFAVVAWWADDLDGDHRDDNIAAICDKDRGFYLVQEGDQLFEADMLINGRHRCPDAAQPPARPAWEVRHAGTVTAELSGTKQEHDAKLAIRDHRLVVVAREDTDWHQGLDTDTADYDALTWTSQHAEWTDERRDSKRVTASSHGVLVLAGPHGVRATKLAGGVTLTATRASQQDKLFLHIHADRPVTLRPCAPARANACTPVRVDNGDRAVQLDDFESAVLVVDTTSIALHVEPLDADQAYPSPPRS